MEPTCASGFRSRWSILLTSQYLMYPESPAHGRLLRPPPVYLGLESGGHSDRPAHRVIVKSRFASLDSIDDVIARLIGV